MDDRISALRVAPEQIEQGLRAIAEASVYFAIATLLLAVLTALLLQAFYDFWLRRSTNQKTVYRWLTERRDATFANVEKWLARRLTHKPSANEPVPDAKAPTPRSMVEEMRKRSGLEEIGIARDSAIFDLPFPTLCAQISAALQNAIDLGRAPAVALVFAGLQEREVERGPEATPPEENPIWVDSLIDQSLRRPRETSAEQRSRERQIVTLRVERGVDELQSELTRAWTRSVYRWSFGISVLLLGMLLLGATGIRASIASFVIIIFVVLAAALLAPPLQRLLARAFVAR